MNVVISNGSAREPGIQFEIYNEAVKCIWLWGKFCGLAREDGGYTWAAGEDVAQIEDTLEKFSEAESFSVRVEVKTTDTEFGTEFARDILCANLRLTASSLVVGPHFFPQLEACGIQGWREFVSPRQRKKARTADTCQAMDELIWDVINNRQELSPAMDELIRDWINTGHATPRQ